MKKYLIFVVFGAFFGFLLSRAGATRYDVISDMFLFKNLQLIWVIGTAFALNLIVFQIVRRTGLNSRDGQPLAVPQRPYHAGIIPGAVLFGLGWALVGVCPGTVMAQLGEGRLASLFIIVGIFAGAWLYPKFHVRWFKGSSVASGAD